MASVSASKTSIVGIFDTFTTPVRSKIRFSTMAAATMIKSLKIVKEQIEIRTHEEHRRHFFLEFEEVGRLDIGGKSESQILEIVLWPI